MHGSGTLGMRSQHPRVPAMLQSSYAPGQAHVCHVRISCLSNTRVPVLILIICRFVPNETQFVDLRAISEWFRAGELGAWFWQRARARMRRTSHTHGASGNLPSVELKIRLRRHRPRGSASSSAAAKMKENFGARETCREGGLRPTRRRAHVSWELKRN